jgi:hypothetical protein
VNPRMTFNWSISSQSTRGGDPSMGSDPGAPAGGRRPRLCGGGHAAPYRPGRGTGDLEVGSVPVRRRLTARVGRGTPGLADAHGRSPPGHRAAVVASVHRPFGLSPQSPMFRPTNSRDQSRLGPFVTPDLRSPRRPRGWSGPSRAGVSPKCLDRSSLRRVSAPAPDGSSHDRGMHLESASGSHPTVVTGPPSTRIYQEIADDSRSSTKAD